MTAPDTAEELRVLADTADDATDHPEFGYIAGEQFGHITRELRRIADRMDATEHDPGAANDPPDPDLDACDTVEEVLGWLLNNAPADERIEVDEVVELALRRIEQIMAVVS